MDPDSKNPSGETRAGDLPPLPPAEAGFPPISTERDPYATVMSEPPLGMPIEGLATVSEADRPQDLPEIPGYELLGVLGRGGMGIVYKARNVRLNRLCAIKAILGEVEGLSESRMRFLAEAQTVASLQHPNIVQIYGRFEHAGQSFLELEYLAGGTLAATLDGEPRPPREAASLMEMLAGAVAEAHRGDVVHRDLKPGNVLMAADGTPKIGDFGLARRVHDDSHMTATGAVLGTPSYMAPEQAEGKAEGVDLRADVYAMGAMLYELVVGRPPFRGATVLQTLELVRTAEPVHPSRLVPGLPRDLETIVLKCLEKDPSRRYPSARELSEDLRRFLDGEAVLARPVSRPERAWRWCRRNPTVAGLLGAVSLSVVAGMAGVVHFAVRANASADSARRYADEATRNARDAERSADRLRDSLIGQYVGNGTFALESSNRPAAMWHFQRAWELDRGGRDEESHRLRLGFTIRTGPQLRTVYFHDRPVQDALFDPTGRLVLTRTDASTAQLWDAATGRPASPPLSHDAEVKATAFSPDGTRVATGSADGTIKIWDARDGAAVATLSQPGAVTSLAYRPDGKRLASASMLGKVQVWDPAEGRASGPTISLPKAAYHVAYRPDGRRLVTADAGDQARVWDAETGKAVTPALPHVDHRRLDEFAIAYRCWPTFSPDGKALVTVSPNTSREAIATLRDAETGEPKVPPFKHGYQIHGVRFSPDGATLAVHCGDAVNLYGTADGKRVGALSHPRESPHSAFSPDGKTLATCSTGGLVHIWDVAGRRQVDQPLRCGDGIQSLAFSPDGSGLLVSSYDGTARIWSLRGPNLLKGYDFDCGHADRLLVELAREKEYARYSPDGRREVRFGGASGARLRDRVGGPREIPLKAEGTVGAARFAPDGRRVFTVDEGRGIRLWEAADGRPVGQVVRYPGRLIAVSTDQKGDRLLTVEQDTSEGASPATKVVTVWEVASGRAAFGPMKGWDSGPQRFGERALHGQISQAALSPDGRRLALGADATGTLGVWDVDAGRELARAPGYRGILSQILFSADGKRFLTFGSDTVARLWDAASCLPAGPPLRHSRFCRRADLAPDGRRVVTVDAAQTVRLWDAGRGDLLGLLRPEGEFDDLRTWFSADGRRIVTDGGKSALELPRYDGPAESLPTLLRLLTGLQLDPDDTINPIEARTFIRDPAAHDRAWRAWRR